MRPHSQSSGNDPGTSGYLPIIMLVSLPSPLSTGQRHNSCGYKGRPQSYPVQKGSFHACRAFGHWRQECKSIQNVRLPKGGYLYPAFLLSPQQKFQQQQQQKNLEKTEPVKIENMKDKYDYVSGKSIDSEEEYLINFD